MIKEKDPNFCLDCVIFTNWGQLWMIGKKKNRSYLMCYVGYLLSQKKKVKCFISFYFNYYEKWNVQFDSIFWVQ